MLMLHNSLIKLRVSFVEQLNQPFFVALGLSLAVFISSADAQDKPALLFGYGEYQSAPYALVENGVLTGGLLFDVGSALAVEMDRKLEFVNVPRKRLAGSLAAGSIHIRCHLSPVWMKEPDKFLWTPTLYKSKTIVAALTDDAPDIETIADLKGKTIGTVLGFKYADEIEGMFKDNTAVRADSAAVSNLIKMMGYGRVDVVIGTKLILQYEIQKAGADNLYEIAPLEIRSQDIQCAISKTSSALSTKILMAMNALINRNVILGYYNQYAG